MLDIGWTEVLVISVVVLFVVGPRDIPKVLRTVGQWAGKIRALAKEFRESVDDAVREAELDEVRKTVEAARGGFRNEIRATVDPGGELTRSLQDVRVPSEPTKPVSTNAEDQAAAPAAAPASAPPAGPPTVPGGTPLAQPGGAPPTPPGGTPMAPPGGTPMAPPGGTPMAQPGGAPLAQPGGTPSVRPGGTPPAQPAETKEAASRPVGLRHLGANSPEPDKEEA